MVSVNIEKRWQILRILVPVIFPLCMLLALDQQECHPQKINSWAKQIFLLTKITSAKGHFIHEHHFVDGTCIFYAHYFHGQKLFLPTEIFLLPEINICPRKIYIFLFIKIAFLAMNNALTDNICFFFFVNVHNVKVF